MRHFGAFVATAFCLLSAIGSAVSTSSAAASPVRSKASACSAIKNRVSSAHRIQIKIIAFCDVVSLRNSPRGFYIMAIHSNRECDGICSTLMGWYAINRVNGRIFEWSVADQKIGPEVVDPKVARTSPTMWAYLEFCGNVWPPTRTLNDRFPPIFSRSAPRPRQELPVRFGGKSSRSAPAQLRSFAALALTLEWASRQRMRTPSLQKYRPVTRYGRSGTRKASQHQRPLLGRSRCRSGHVRVGHRKLSRACPPTVGLQCIDSRWKSFGTVGCGVSRVMPWRQAWTGLELTQRATIWSQRTCSAALKLMIGTAA